MTTPINELPGRIRGVNYSTPTPKKQKPNVRIYGDTDTSFSKSILLPGKDPRNQFNFMGKMYDTKMEMVMAMMDEMMRNPSRWHGVQPTPPSVEQMGRIFKSSDKTSGGRAYDLNQFGIADRFTKSGG